MVNEIEKVELFGQNNDGEPIRFTIADGTSTSKGTLMTLTDARTVINPTTNAILPRVHAGVANQDHEANVGDTSISVWTDFIGEAICSGAIPVGAPVAGLNFNFVTASDAYVIAASGSIIGRSLEAGSNNEIINVRFRF